MFKYISNESFGVKIGLIFAAVHLALTAIIFIPQWPALSGMVGIQSAKSMSVLLLPLMLLCHVPGNGGHLSPM